MVQTGNGFNRLVLYSDPSDFFTLNGNCVMVLSRAAARQVIEQLKKDGVLVLGYEGGIWTASIYQFEARRDAIWNGDETAKSKSQINQSNTYALNCLEEEDNAYNAFIITARSD
jgi:hypothetical protein